MGDELKKNLGAAIDLIAGSNGVYDVAVTARQYFQNLPREGFPRQKKL